MRYLILVAAEGQESESSPDHAAFTAYVAVHGTQLSSATLADADQATTVRRLGGDVLIGDGPLVEGAEMISGYYDVELPDLDHAIAAATLLPGPCSLEIRPTIKIG